MITTRLFRITQSSLSIIGYVLIGLRQTWTSADYKFDSEFDAVTGDYYVVVKTNFIIPKNHLARIIAGTNL